MSIHKSNPSRMIKVLLPILIPAVLAVILGIFCTYYYDLNDDSLMKEILSGEFTGAPEARNIQSYYPLTLLLAGLYHLFPGSAVYGIFLLVLQFGCLGAVLARIGGLFRNREVLIKGTSSGEILIKDNSAGENLTGEDTDGKDPDRDSSERDRADRGNGNDRPGIRYPAACLLATGLFCGLMLYHLVFLQYSITVGMFAAASAFLFLTMRDPEERLSENTSSDPSSRSAASERGTRCKNAGGWILALLPGAVPIWIGFLLRSEMMLFLSPLVGLALLLRLFGGRRRRSTGNSDIGAGTSANGSARWKALLLAVLLVCGGMAAGYGINRAAYSSPEWRTFYNLFDARTRLYDFEKLPTWEDDAAFYRSIGLDESEAELIRNYNFGIDDRIDADTLNRIADYAQEKAGQNLPTGQRLRNALWDYRHAFADEANRPFVLILGTLYLLTLGRILADLLHSVKSGSSAEKPAHWLRKPVTELAAVLLLFVIRSGLLLYLYYNQRPVDRLTHSLYLVEAVILSWLLFHWQNLPAEDPGIRNRSRRGQQHPAGIFRIAAVPVLLAVSLSASVLQYGTIQQEQTAREEKNLRYDLLKKLASAHPDNVYFTDVYSTVDFSDLVFGDDPVPVNWDLMGGWASKSPLEMAKLRYLGCTAGTAQDADPAYAEKDTGLIMQEALLYLDNCYVIVKEEGDLQWLADYYRFRGTDVSLVPADRIRDSSGETGWDLYRVSRN